MSKNARNPAGNRRILIAAVGMAVAVWAAPPPALATNWFKLQGVSPRYAPLAKVSGFFEPTYTSVPGSAAYITAPAPSSSGYYIPHANEVGPQFTSHNSFNIFRARVMVRGNIKTNISYFVGLELGNNGFTQRGSGYSPSLIDAHVTFSHYIPYARIEAGIIRAPGPQQAMQGYMAYNFTNFSNVVQQMMIPTLYDPTAIPVGVVPTPTGGAYELPSTASEGNNAFRYPGVMAMDWFTNGRWQFAYGVMVGNYSPTVYTNYGSSPLVAARVQESYIFGGHGPFRSDVTGFAWYQHADPLFNTQTYTMNRDGVGLTYSQGYMHTWGRWVKAEYMRGQGMIETPAVFSSSATLSTPALVDAEIYPGAQNTARGYYIGGGLFLTRRLEFDLRYDYYNRLPNAPVDNRVFTTEAVGFQYHFTPLTRVMLDYYFRQAKIPDVSAIPVAQRANATDVVNSFDNEVEIEGVVSF